MTSRLLDILQAPEPARPLSEALNRLKTVTVDRPEEAAAVCDRLNRLLNEPLTDQTVRDVYALAGLFQKSSTTQVFLYFVRLGVPTLVRHFDRIVEAPEGREPVLMALLKLFATFGTEEAFDRIVGAAHLDALATQYVWTVLFDGIRNTDPIIPGLVERLIDPMPRELAQMGLLDWVNRLCREGTLAAHPFDRPEGVAELQKWLTSADPEEYSFAHSSAAAIPFVSEPARERLLALALDHASPQVQMEAAWASAKLGSESGLKFLSRLCLEPATSRAACQYLEELGASDRIPDEALDEDFQATAEMCEWLAHPMEFGEAPSELELVDSREIAWPPTNDRRPVWLFRYRYEGDEEDNPPREGLGMVGSVTFALFGETTADLSPEDAYAIHCCWELQSNGDPRAPQARTVEYGRRLLEEAEETIPHEGDDDETWDN